MGWWAEWELTIWYKDWAEEKAQLWQSWLEKTGWVQRRAIRDLTTGKKVIMTTIKAMSDICQARTMCQALYQALYWLYLTDLHNTPRTQVQLLCPFYRKLRL